MRDFKSIMWKINAIKADENGNLQEDLKILLDESSGGSDSGDNESSDDSDTPSDDDSGDEEGSDDDSEEDGEDGEDDTEESDDEDEDEVDETESDEIEDSDEGEGEDEDELAETKRMNKELIEKINSLLEAGKKDDAKDEAKETVTDIFDDDDYKKLVEVLDLKPEGAVVLSMFLKKVMNQTQQDSVEKALRSTPKVVGSFINRKRVIEKARETFYNNNPQLTKVKSYVVNVANDVAAENPEWDLTQVMDEAAKQSYKALGLKRAVQKKEKERERKKPAFVKGGKGGRKPVPKKTVLEKQINEILDLEE